MPAMVYEFGAKGEDQQTTRFRWRRVGPMFYVVDSETMDSRCIGLGERLFCDATGDNCLKCGSPDFYDTLRAYFANEQREIAMTYFGIRLQVQEVVNG